MQVYDCKNRQTAASIASENLRKPHVRAKIDERLEENTLAANQVLYILTQHALGDIRRVLNESGEPDFKKAIENHATHTIKRWKKRTIETKETTVEEFDIELHDPQAAAVQLGRAYKLFTDKVEVMDWRTDAIMAIRSGDVEYDDIAEVFDDDLAAELFREAGVPVAATG